VRFSVFIATFQCLVLLAHLLLYETWMYFWRPSDPAEIFWLRLGLAVLSISFLGASLLAFRYNNLLMRMFYRVAAVWLGTSNFLFQAAIACWVVYAVALLFGIQIERRVIAGVLLGAATAVSVFGIVNAAWTRVTKVSVKLPNLPETWRGREAALVSDMHLGHVRSIGFVQRIVRMLTRLGPSIVFIAGDLYDGTAANIERLAEPWKGIAAPLGAYFVEGNHEEFRDHTPYLQALGRAGVRVLNNEAVTVDGLQLVGVHYRDATHAQHFRSVLQRAGLDRQQASVLLTHAPDRLAVAEDEGISLQLSGHTHRGQFFPFTWITRRIYGPYVYGLRRLGDMLVYTSSGAGTWGPPLRVGSTPEIVLIRFE
jgi:uncharacterized protein